MVDAFSLACGGDRTFCRQCFCPINVLCILGNVMFAIVGIALHDDPHPECAGIGITPFLVLVVACNVLSALINAWLLFLNGATVCFDGRGWERACSGSNRVAIGISFLQAFLVLVFGGLVESSLAHGACAATMSSAFLKFIHAAIGIVAVLTIVTGVLLCCLGSWTVENQRWYREHREPEPQPLA